MGLLPAAFYFNFRFFPGCLFFFLEGGEQERAACVCFCYYTEPIRFPFIITIKLPDPIIRTLHVWRIRRPIDLVNLTKPSKSGGEKWTREVEQIIPGS